MLTSEYILYPEVNPTAILIGVWHEEPIQVPQQLLEILPAFNKRYNRIFFEGQEVENSVRNFLSRYNLKGSLRSWEPSGIPEDATLALDLWGGDYRPFERQVLSASRKAQTIIDALVASAQEWHGRPVDAAILQKVVKFAGLTDWLNQPLSQLRNFHERGRKIFENPSSPVYALFDKANKIRQARIVQLVKSQHGLFFAGNSHVEPIKAML